MKQRFNIPFIILLIFASYIESLLAQELVDSIAVVVNNDLILYSEWMEKLKFKLTLDRLMGKNLQGTDLKRYSKEVLEEMIDELLLKQKGAEMQISVSSDEVENTINELAQQNNLTKENFYNTLKEEGIDKRLYREDIKIKILKSKLLQARFQGSISVPESQVKSYYLEMVSKARQTDQVRFQYVVISSKKVKNNEELLNIATKIKGLWSIGDPFDKIISDIKANYPDIELNTKTTTWLKKEEIPPKLFSILLRLEEGKISEPIKTPEGIYILKPLEWYSSKFLPYDKIKYKLKLQLLEEIMEQKLKQWLIELRSTAYIKYYVK